MTSLRGDVTGVEVGVPDGILSIADVVYLNNYVANKTIVPNPYPLTKFELGDVTGQSPGVPEGIIDIADVVYLNNHVANLSIQPNPYPLPSALEFVQMELDETNQTMNLYMDTSYIPEDTGYVSGIQLYFGGIQLVTKVDSDSYYQDYATDLQGGDGWIVASNYFDEHKLSIAYMERSNDKRIARTAEKNLILLNKFEYTGTPILPRIVKFQDSFKSLIVDVTENSVVSYEL